ncbi:EAL domain-containing protein [Paenibacillus aurantiacus]|uniref:EAL domain-containing protein n=1 Tax=Paenibacillus aurantiacus TaxID=1936118 RepID=A0ABV5KVQ4_9BACL
MNQSQTLMQYYPIGLIIICLIISVFASYIALDLPRLLLASRGRARRYWFLGGSSALGFGLWALHVIGTLNYRREGGANDYYLTALLSSLGIAILVAFACSGLSARREIRTAHMVRNGLLLGLGVCGMHAAGALALDRTRIVYSPVLLGVAALLTILVGVSMQILAYRFRRPASPISRLAKAGCSIALGVIVAAVQYVGMMALRLSPIAYAETDEIEPNLYFWLALGVAGWSILVLGVVMLVANFLDRRIAQQVALNGSLIEAASDSIVVIDAAGRIMEFNPAAERIFGHRRSDAVGRLMPELLFTTLLGNTYREAIARYVRNPSDNPFGERTETTGMRADGTMFPLELTVTRIRKADPPILVAFMRDITERRRAEAALRESEERYRKLVHYSPDPVIVHLNGMILFVNSAAGETLGAREPEELMGRFLSDFIHPDDKEIADIGLNTPPSRLAESGPVELRCYKLSGELIDLEVKSIFVKWNGRGVMQTIARDVTAKKQAAQTIRQMAYYDRLTGLANRNLFLELVHGHLKQCEDDGVEAAIMFIDLDRFKTINDTLGHHVGDELLKAFSGVLASSMRKGDILSRIAGDEFLVLVPGTMEAEAADIARTILSHANTPFKVEGYSLIVTPSIGIAMFPKDSRDAEELIKYADAAMYRTKELGKNGYSFYDSNVRTISSREMQLEQGLHKALEQDEFLLHYQPRFDLQSGRIAGVEALVRWHSPEYGMVSPAEFIPLAEESGLIVPIGELILRKACEQNRRWIDAGYPPVRMAVNLSLVQFRQVHLVERIEQILRETGLPGELLELEITESVASQNEGAVAERLQAVKARGITVSIDDFGTGYSSLSYLRQYPLDVLKIDRSFIRNLPHSSDDTAIVQAIIAMAHSLHLSVCAEGVETKEQLDFLREHGCCEVQGYYLSKPKPAEEIERILGTTIASRIESAS